MERPSKKQRHTSPSSTRKPHTSPAPRNTSPSRKHSNYKSPKPKEKLLPDYKPSGALIKDQNSVNGIILKYTLPPESRSPTTAYRLFIFKKSQLISQVPLTQPAYLLGREPSICDIPLLHPSISKQHAVIQFRLISSTNEFGDKVSSIKPYLIDLESSNGSFLNTLKIEAGRYVELFSGDVIKFGASEREYVLIIDE